MYKIYHNMQIKKVKMYIPIENVSRGIDEP